MATQFSIVWAPPVATLVMSYHRIISVGTACGDPFVPFDFIASFLLAPPVATQCSVFRAPPVAIHAVSYHRTISAGHRLWHLSFLVCHTVSCMFGHQPASQQQPVVHTYIHTYIVVHSGGFPWGYIHKNSVASLSGHKSAGGEPPASQPGA